MTDRELIDQAIKALKINVPIYRAEVKGNTVTLYLYGRSQPAKWTKRTRRKAPKSAKTAPK